MGRSRHERNTPQVAVPWTEIDNLRLQQLKIRKARRNFLVGTWIACIVSALEALVIGYGLLYWASLIFLPSFLVQAYSLFRQYTTDPLIDSVKVFINLNLVLLLLQSVILIASTIYIILLSFDPNIPHPGRLLGKHDALPPVYGLCIFAESVLCMLLIYLWLSARYWRNSLRKLDEKVEHFTPLNLSGSRDGVSVTQSHTIETPEDKKPKYRNPPLTEDTGVHFEGDPAAS